jgi:hypothetical protein
MDVKQLASSLLVQWSYTTTAGSPELYKGVGLVVRSCQLLLLVRTKVSIWSKSFIVSFFSPFNWCHELDIEKVQANKSTVF